MPCYHPLTAYRSRAGRDPATGKWPIVFNVTQGYSDMELQIPCGQCIGCRLERSRQWAIRCVHEAEIHGLNNCFVTLTYDDDHLPSGGTLVKSHMSKFMKDLRNKFGSGIRFFGCGEYGELYKRPHFHIILFGFKFSDEKYHGMRNGYPVFTSDLLKGVWKNGYHEIGSVSFESAAYVARYITKKVTGDLAAKHYCGREPEFVNMSRRPGIARVWFERFYKDVYNHDTCVVRRGMIARPPKYYDKCFDLLDHDKLELIKYRRMRKAIKSVDNTPARLRVRERVKLSQFSKLIRPLEKSS